MHLVGGFDEAHVRSYIRTTLETAHAHACPIELVLKDTHTCEHHPERFDHWSTVAREEVSRIAGG